MTLQDYATRHGLTLAQARQALADLALQQLAARAAGGHIVAAARTKEERSEAARKAVTARWAKARQKSHSEGGQP
jgi:hypothetical protein